MSLLAAADPLLEQYDALEAYFAAAASLTGFWHQKQLMQGFATQ